MGTDLEALRALAAGVAVDRSLEVVVGPPGCGWSIHTHTGRIQVDPADLQTLPEEELFGLTCHEAAHAAVTRYPWLVPPSVLSQPGVATLLNALEDCRIEDWLVRRLPGTRPWIERYNDRLFPADGAELAAKAPFVQYALASVHLWWHGELPEGLDAGVKAALATTRAARERVIAAQPPVRPDTACSARYESSRVARVFRRIDGIERVDGFEQEVRLAAAEAWAIVWREILPEVRVLIARSTDLEAKREEAAFLARFGSMTEPVRLARPRRAESASFAPVDKKRHDAARTPPIVDSWDAARRDVLPLIDGLVDTLLRVLRPRSLPRWIPNHPTGQRLDLRAAMRHEARPDPWSLWQRKTVPEKADPCFALLLDLSGSMAGDPIHWGFRGTVLLAEVLARLDLPFGIWGFQDRPIPFKGFGASLSAARPALSAMPEEVSGSRSGGHNRPDHNWDGPVLHEVADALLAHRSRSPVLIVVSDGAPSGPENATRALHQAVAAVQREVALVGVGLGPGTRHVRDFYPRAIAEVPLRAFPSAIGRCIQEALGVR